MKIQQFSQLGKRGNNEDSLGRNEVLLTVCDGMGGHNYGERASAFVVEHLLEAFSELQPLGKTEIQQHLSKVQADLNLLLEQEPELERMGTTFTGIVRTPDVWYAAHIGDSRIYLFRPAERKLWHTWDHSLVGELMRTHEITVEAGRFHPLSNRISKAIIAERDKKPASASIVKIDELKAGDILLLCSDGVVEAWGDWELVQLMADESLTFEQKCQEIARQCDENSKDNNTAIIAEIESADAFSYGSNDELEWTTFDEVEADYKHYLADSNEEEPELESDGVAEVKAPTPPTAPKPAPVAAPKTPSKPKPAGTPFQSKKAKTKKPWLIIALVLVVAAMVLFLVLRQNNTKDDDDTPTKSKKTEKIEKKKTKKNTGAKNQPTKTAETTNPQEPPAGVDKDISTPDPNAGKTDNSASNQKDGNKTGKEKEGIPSTNNR